ncbi:G2/M phase-specific E3 ubiquitin-protein ligase [Alosa pseudoharengus]|uniref:G2/M phase-specific E3 ubiquitin-protein ligase n=1 Tax=Alosa pseudoharengus TaxID=34774 RepID=UPI003F8A39C6
MIAVCVVHGGVGPHFFFERLYQQVCEIPTPPARVDEINDRTFREQLIKIQDAETVEEANNAISSAGDSLNIIGALRYISRLEDKNMVVQTAADFYVDGRRQSALEQFAEGLRTLGLLREMREHPHVFYSMFVSEVRPLRARDLQDLFEVVYSVEGSNRRAAESRTMCFFMDWLIDIQGGECAVSLEQVLEFTSGASTVPPLGFPQQPQVTFLHEGKMLFPEANTCLIVLRLPIHQEYETFCQFMEEGILQAPCFGMI